MSNEDNITRDNDRDAGTLDAVLKGKKVSADAELLLKAEQQLALKAREINEHQHIDADVSGGDWSFEQRKAWLKKHDFHHRSAFQETMDDFYPDDDDSGSGGHKKKSGFFKAKPAGVSQTQKAFASAAKPAKKTSKFSPGQHTTVQQAQNKPQKAKPAAPKAPVQHA